MVNIVPMKKFHLDRLHAQGAQEYVSAWITDDVKRELEHGMSFAAVDGDRVLGCAGVVEYWNGRAAAWAILGSNLGRQFVAVHRAVKTFLDLSDYKRLEATTDIGFCNGHRWLEMLGFAQETERMPAYLPNGGDAAMYVRFK